MRRRLAIVAGIVVLLLVAAYGVGAAYVYNRLSVVKAHCADDPPEVVASTPDRFTAPGRAIDVRPYFMPAPASVTFPSRDAGITISGWYIPAKDHTAPVVVVVHGRDACKHVATVLLPAGMLYRNGFSILLIDLRDHGDSTIEDGRYAGGTEEYRDVLGAWDWAQSANDTPSRRIGLLGTSLGAASVLDAMGAEPRVAATWEDSGPADIPSALRHLLRQNGYPEFLEIGGVLMAGMMSGDDLLSPSPLDAMRKLDGRPLYIAHGDEDETIDVRAAPELSAAAASDDVEVWIIHGARHVEAMFLYPDEYERRLVGFFRRAIGS